MRLFIPLQKKHENNGRCGVCGDPWDAPEPRPNEAGGIYARGIIGQTYPTDKRYIDSVIQVTSSMGGYFEFHICPNNNVLKRVDQECLDKYPLQVLSKDRTTSYGRRFYPDILAGTGGIVELSLEIPEGLECTQCVLQWRWHGGMHHLLLRLSTLYKNVFQQSRFIIIIAAVVVVVVVIIFIILILIIIITIIIIISSSRSSGV